MSRVPLERKIGSAFVVLLGHYGQVCRFAQQQGLSRQYVYREAKAVRQTLQGDHVRAELDRLKAQNVALREQVAHLQQRLDAAVVLDDPMQSHFATVGQACGVTLSQCRSLLDVLSPGNALSVQTLGRRTKAAAQKAGPLLKVLDEYTRKKVLDGAADEIYVRDPVLMVVEQESLCWVTGKLSDEVSGEVWRDQFKQLPHLEQLARDGGTALAKGAQLLNAERAAKGQAPLVEQGDHFHALRSGGVGLRRFEKRAGAALAKAEEAQQALEDCARQGQKQTGPAVRARHAWRQAEAAMDQWIAAEQTWQKTKQALRLITPEGELNTRDKAQAVLAQTLPQLPDADFAKTKRQLQKPEMLNYLDRVQSALAKLPMPQEVKEAAVRQELLRRQPKSGNAQAVAMRGAMLAMYALALSNAGARGVQAVGMVQEIFRRAYRASSLVECINSVLRMQQAQHRRMTQELLDLKRLYWNCHRFRTGRRRGTTPYERLGIRWPKGLNWWEALKLTPEQLRDKLSTAEAAE